MKKTLFLYILLFFVVGTVSSQLNPRNDKPVEVNNPAKLRALARQSVKLHDSYSAMYYYEKLYSLDHEDLEVLEQLAKIYKSVRNYSSAAAAFKELYDACLLYTSPSPRDA